MQFEQLIHTYKQPLYHIFLRMTQQEEAATLFLMDVFTEAAKKFPLYDETVSLKI